MNQKIIIHHLELSKTTLNLSGGEKAMIEFVSYFQKNGYKNVIYSSETAKMAYSKLKDFKDVDHVVIGRICWERINPFFAYFLRFFQLFLGLRKFPKAINIILMHEDFLPTTIFGFLLKIINPQSKGFLVFHLKSPRIRYGFMGEFANKKYPISLSIVRFWLEQNLSLLLSRWVRGIVAVNPFYKPFLLKKFPSNKVYSLPVFGGSDIPENNDQSKDEKVYDLVFMARFQKLKGLDDLLEIFDYVRKEKPELTLAIIGGGYSDVEKKLTDYILGSGLNNQIKYFGYLTGNEKYDILLRSKVFVLPSYFESYGLVRLEAASCALPTVSYDLPTYKIFGDENLIVAPIGDKVMLAQQIIKLLNDKVYYESKKKAAKELSGRFSWSNTALELEKIIFDEKKL